MQLDPTSDDAFRAFLPGQQQEDDRSLIVEFFVGKKLIGVKSVAAGKPVYEDREYVKIMIKGQDKQIVVEEVRPHHKTKFPIAYHLFQQQKPLPVVGTPVELMPGVGPSMAHHFKGMNLRTVEDLANVTDENTLGAMGAGARELVKRAKAWLTQSSERTQGLEAENQALKAQLADLVERMAALEQKPAGRRKKAAA